jgi:hypothetical protein
MDRSTISPSMSPRLELTLDWAARLHAFLWGAEPTREDLALMFAEIDSWLNYQPYVPTEPTLKEQCEERATDQGAVTAWLLGVLCADAFENDDPYAEIVEATPVVAWSRMRADVERRVWSRSCLTNRRESADSLEVSALMPDPIAALATAPLKREWELVENVASET